MNFTKLGALVTTFAVLGGLVSGCGSTNQAGADTKEFKIAFVGPLTGPLSASGRVARDGLKAGAAYANTLGGTKFVVEQRDTKGDPSVGAAVARELAQEGVRAFYASSGELAAVQPVANQYKAFVADGGGITPMLPKMGDSREFPWVFCTTVYCGKTNVNAVVKFAADASKDGKIGQLADSGPFGEGSAKLTGDVAGQEGLSDKVVTQRFAPSAADVTAQLRDLRDAGAQSLIVWTYGAPLLMVMQSMDRIGWYPYVIVPSADSATVQAMPSQLKGRVAAGPLASTLLADKSGAAPNELRSKFSELYKKEAGKDELSSVDTAGAVTFDWVLVLAASIEGAGSTDTEKMKSWLTGGEVIETAQGPMRFGKDGEERVGIAPENTGLYDVILPCLDFVCQRIAPTH